MLIPLARLLSLTVLLSLQGCFYLVEEGKGGVAERFTVPGNYGYLSKRIQHCEAIINEHSLLSKPRSYPALYREARIMLTESRRLYKAEYYQQAEAVLEPVERVLHLMQEGLHVRAASALCQQRPDGEVCL